MIKKFRISYNKIITYIILLILSAVILMPVIFMICGSLMGKSEILNSFGNLITDNKSVNGKFHIIPEQVTLIGYADVFFQCGICRSSDRRQLLRDVRQHG